MSANPSKMLANRCKVTHMAETANVSNVLITSKGEPLLKADLLLYWIQSFAHLPVEVQTNGLWLAMNDNYVIDLHRAGLDTVAISVDRPKQLDFDSVIAFLARAIHNVGMTCRFCVNVTDLLSEVPGATMTFVQIMDKIVKIGAVTQVLFRRIMVPNKRSTSKGAILAAKWIEDNTDPRYYDTLCTDMKECLVNRGGIEKNLIRTLPHGAQVFDVDGIAVSFSDYCIQECNNTEDVRSLIFMEDGHMYTSWDKVPSSRLF